MYFLNGFTSICLIFVILYGIGLLIFLSDFEENKCDMTYMFEYPQFVKISNKYDEQFTKYGLYAYSEGTLTTKVRNMHFDGIPVLFLPGNAGSYKQVRSLSSVALRKALSLRSPYHFDYFTIDFNSELSGVYGPLLYDQLEYAKYSLNRVMELYREESKPSSIIVIGHSVGGVIAKKLAEMKTNSVSILIALAAPLKRSPIIFDHHIDSFYNDYSSTKNNNTLIISISGGYSDFLVPSYLSDIEGYNLLHTMTTNIPRSWIEANHVDIVWCKQVVLAINRALFDSIDTRTKQISTNVTYLNKVFEHHLIQHSGTKVRKLESYSKAIEIDYKGKWIESLLRQYSIELFHGLKETHWYMVKLNSLSTHEILTVLAINVETENWVFACNAYFPKGASKVCPKAIHLTHLSEISPSIKHKRRYLQINMHDLRKNNTELTHVVIRALPTKGPVVFHIDIHNSAERRIIVDLPSWWSFKKTLILKETSKNAIHYDLVLPQLQHVLQFYQLFVEPLNCEKSTHHASATLKVTWGNQNLHAYFTEAERNPLNIRLYTSKPLFNSNDSAVVKLTLEPSCTYQLSIKPSIFGSLGQMARIYTPLWLTNIAVIVLMILRYQLRRMQHGTCPIFFVAIKEGIKPYYILPFVKILSILLSKIEIYNFLPKADIFYLTEDGTEFFAAPMILFVCSIGMVLVLGVLYLISLITLDSTIHKLSLKLTGMMFFSVNGADFINTLIEKAPFIAAGTLVFTSISTCGSLALCLGTIFYFLKLSHMSQDYIEKVVWFFIKGFAEKCKQIIRKQTYGVTKKQRDETKHSENLAINKYDSTSDNTENITNVKDDKENVSEKKHTELSGTKIFKDELRNEEEEILDESTQNAKRKQNNIEPNELYKQKHEADLKKRAGVHKENECNISENDDIKTVKKKADNEFLTANNSLFFHSTIFFVWCIITLINLPATLTWAHNYKFNKTLSPDSSLIPGLVLSLCALPLWQFELPRTGRKWSTQLEIFVMVIAVLSLIFASISIYRLSYLLTLLIVVLICHQLFAPEKTTDIEESAVDGDNENKSNFENVKLKLN